MSIEPITSVTSGTFVLHDENIDTDQIIPARFLTTTGKDSLADACFHDWRFEANGQLTDHPLNTTDIAEHRVLVAGNNFGCGSSREHAPWALLALGFRVVISTEIADIFRSNALKNGLLAIAVDDQAFAALTAEPGSEVTVDLAAEEISVSGQTIPFQVEPFARRCLLNGQDSLDVLLEALPLTKQFEDARP